MHDGRWGASRALRQPSTRRLSTSAAPCRRPRRRPRPSPSQPPPSALPPSAPTAVAPRRRRADSGWCGARWCAGGAASRALRQHIDTCVVAPASRIAWSNVRAGWAGATSHDPVGTSPEQATHSETTRRARPELRRPSSHTTWARVVGGCRGKAVRKPEDPSGVQGGGRARTHLRAAGRSRSSAWLSPCRHRLESRWNVWLGARPACAVAVALGVKPAHGARLSPARRRIKRRPAGPAARPPPGCSPRPRPRSVLLAKL